MFTGTVLVLFHRVAIIGDYSKHECSIRLSSLNELDSGSWRCDLEEYISRLNIFTTATRVFHVFHVNITSGRKNTTTGNGPLSADGATSLGANSSYHTHAEKQRDDDEPLDVEK